MEERAYRNLPEREADVVRNPYGVGYSTVYRVYVGETKIHVYVENNESNQRTSWTNRTLFILDKATEAGKLEELIPASAVDFLNEKFPGMIPSNDPKTVD
jgi:hypothetical protein